MSDVIPRLDSGEEHRGGGPGLWVMYVKVKPRDWVNLISSGSDQGLAQRLPAKHFISKDRLLELERVWTATHLFMNHWLQIHVDHIHKYTLINIHKYFFIIHIHKYTFKLHR